MATVNALSVALFNAAAGGYASELAANPANFANAVGPVLQKDISTDALFVDHLLGNLGVTSTSSVYAQAKAAVAALVTTKGRAGAATDAIDFLKAQEGSTNAYAAIAADFAAKVNKAATFTLANSTERDITRLISGVTGVDTDVVAINNAVAAQKAADDAAAVAAAKAASDAAVKAAADAAAALKAAQDKAAADLTAANKVAADAAAAAAKTAADAAAKAAADAAAALKAATDKAAADQAAAVAAQKAADDAAAATAAAKAAADLKAANDQIAALKNPVGQATTLSANADTVLGVTGGNDTITATDTTYTSNDLIVDASTTDSDVLNFTAAAGVTSTNSATVIGIEALNFNFNSFGTPTVTATNVRTGTLTVNQSQAGASGDATVSGINNVTVKAGTGITGTLALNTVTADSAVGVNAGDAATVTVTAVANGSTTVTGGSKLNSVSVEGKTASITTAKSSSSVTILGTSGTSDSATVTAGAATSITIGGTSKDVETLTVSGNGVSTTATIGLGAGGATPTTFVAAGSNNVTLKGDGAIFSGKTVTDSSTATSTVFVDGPSTLATTLDLSKAAVDAISIADAVNGSNTLVTFANNANVTFTEDLATATKTLTLDIDDQTTANVTTGVVTLALSKAQSGGAIAVDATSSSDNIATLNLVNDTVAQTGLNLTAGTAVTVNVSGSKDVVFAATSTAKAINAAGATGAITVTYDNTNDIATVTGGSGADTFTNSTTAIGTKVTINGGAGNDNFTMLSTAKAAIDGGDGYDKVTLAGDITSLTMTNVEELALSAAVSSAKATQLSGKSFIMSGAYSWTFGTSASNFDTSTIDLSGLTINNTTGFTVDASNGLSTALYTTATGATITGSSVADTIKGTANADVINGGAGNDVLTGNAGADTINGGSGSDVIYGDNAGTKAVAAFTISTAATSTNTVTINIHGVDVAVVIPATTSAALQATQIADAISGNASLANVVTASASSATVTITSLVDGNTFGVDLTAGTAAGITVKESGTASLVIADGLDSGSTAQTVTGTAAAIEVISGSVVGTAGSSATDTLTGGTGTDVFVFNLNNAGAAPSATVFDTITDFTTASDVIDYAPAAITIVTNATASAGTAKITSAGVATFDSTDNTLALKIVAAENGINAGGSAAAGQTVIFQDGADAYVFISDGTDGVGANDVLIKLVGVDTTSTAFDVITLSNGNMTLA